MGRPTLIKEDMIRAVVETLHKGASRKLASQTAGVDPQTFYTWMKLGRRDIAAGNPNTPRAKLLQAVEQAEAEAEQLLADKVRQLGQGGIIEVPVLDKLNRPVRNPETGEFITQQVYERPKWEAMAWLLERRFPDEWGKRRELIVTRQERPVAPELDDSQVVALFEQATALLDAAREQAKERQRQRLEARATLLIPPEDSTGE